jgi:hypothetical protein
MLPVKPFLDPHNSERSWAPLVAGVWGLQIVDYSLAVPACDFMSPEDRARAAGLRSVETA